MVFILELLKSSSSSSRKEGEKGEKGERPKERKGKEKRKELFRLRVGWHGIVLEGVRHRVIARIVGVGFVILHHRYLQHFCDYSIL